MLKLDEPTSVFNFDRHQVHGCDESTSIFHCDCHAVCLRRLAWSSALISPALLAALSRRLSNKAVVFPDPSIAVHQSQRIEEDSLNQALAAKILQGLAFSGAVSVSEWDSPCGPQTVFSRGSSAAQRAPRPALMSHRQQPSQSQAVPEWCRIAHDVVIARSSGTILQRVDAAMSSLSLTAQELASIAATLESYRPTQHEATPSSSLNACAKHLGAALKVWRHSS